VANMPGDSGGAALSHLKGQSGNDHLLIFTLNSFFTVPLTKPNLGIDILGFTPIARLGLDPFLLWVHSDRADIKSIGDFATAVNNAGKWTMAGTGSMQEDELLTILLNSVLKVEMRYQPVGGGGEVARLLADGFVQSTVNNPGEISNFHAARRVKPIRGLHQGQAGAICRYPHVLGTRSGDRIPDAARGRRATAHEQRRRRLLLGRL